MLRDESIWSGLVVQLTAAQPRSPGGRQRV